MFGSNARSWRKIIQLLRKFSTTQLFTSNIRVGSFSSKHAVLEITKVMPASTVYTVCTIQQTIVSNCLLNIYCQILFHLKL